MSIHVDHGSHDVGAEILGPPEDKDGNVSKWREFLKRPENLATALVLLAGVTGPRHRGQSKLNKALTSGVGALGFRGGLEKGVEAQRAEQREEGRTIESQDAEIAARQAATQVAQGNLDVNRGTLGLNQQLADQARQARPLAPSESALNQARANALGRDPNATPNDFESLFSRNIEQFQLGNPGVELPMQQIALESSQQLALIKMGEEGRISAEGFDMTPEEMILFGVEPPAPPAGEGGDAGAAEDGLTSSSRIPQASKDRNAAIGASLRIGGQFSRPSPAGQEATINILKRAGDFGDIPDETILDRLGDTRRLLRDKAALLKASAEDLEAANILFRRAFSTKEKRIMLAAINKKRGSPGANRLFEELLSGGEKK